MKLFKHSLYIAATLLLVACGGIKNLDRSMVPTPGPAPQIQLGQADQFVLENGLKVIVVENHKLPRVSFQLTVDNDPILEGEKAGYLSLAGDLMRTGSTSMSKAEIDEAVDFIGGSLSTSSGGMYAASLKKHEDELLKIMSEILLNPTFPEEELEKARKQMISGLASEKTDPNSMSGKVRRTMNYGLDHPYGEQLNEKTVGNVTRQDLVDFYKSYYKPNTSYLVIVGDVTTEQAKALANQYFGSWAKSDVPTHEYDTPAGPTGREVIFVPLPNAVQSVISVTYPVDLKTGSEDVVKANVMNSILGGGVFSGRLMQNLREDKAFTYGARSSLSSDPLVGAFNAGASVRNEVTDSAIVEILFEMERMTTELVPDSTLEFVKNGMNGSFARSLESPQTIARFALNMERYGLPADYYSSYLERLAAVNPADVMAMAKKYIRPENCFITVVGNKDVAEKLAKFSSSGKVKMVNPDGTEWVDYLPVPDGVSTQSVLDNYINAIGGAEKLSKVTSYVRTGSMGMQGMALDMKIQMKGNSMYKMEAMMGGATVMTQCSNGEQGYSSQMGATEAIEGADLEAMRHQADLMFESNYEKYGVTADLKGMRMVDDAKCYVVEFTLTDGSTYTDYYDENTGLKVRTQKVEESPMGTMTAVTNIVEYMEADGVKFPKVIKQTFGPQSFEITFESIDLNVKISDSVFASK